MAPAGADARPGTTPGSGNSDADRAEFVTPTGPGRVCARGRLTPGRCDAPGPNDGSPKPTHPALASLRADRSRPVGRVAL